MVVCVCNVIREKELLEVAKCGDRPCDAYARLGRKPRCGQCLSFARELLNEKITVQAA